MRAAWLLAAGTIVPWLLPACGTEFTGAEDQAAGDAQGGNAGEAATMPQGGSTHAGRGGAGTTAEAGAAPGPEGGAAGATAQDDCPSQKGSAMVRLPSEAGGFCIDARETSRAEYAAFLEDPQGVAPQPAHCAWNSSYAPSSNPSSADMELPQTFVDFCDARAFCEWAGKRLCGKIGGGSVPFASYNDATVSQWQAACSRGGTRFFPYGNIYDGTMCNGADAGNKALVSVMDQTCEGGYDGIFNMSGNAWEWEDSCQGTNVSDTCRLRSGEYSNPQNFLRCDYGGFSIKRDFVSNTVGIRCCGP